MRLADKVAIITGGGSGIGRAGVLRFAAEGAKVVVADINDERGTAVVRDVQERGGDAFYVRTDVSSTEQVQALVRAAVDHYGKITVLWNNAAPIPLVTYDDRSVMDLPEDVFDRMIAVILRGCYLCCKYALPEIIRAGGGSIINTSTTDAVVGQGGYDAYAAAKGGILSLTRAMAVGYAPHNVRVNAILPGFIRTPATEGWLSRDAPRRVIESLHLTRVGEPDDIASFAAYLASDEAAFVTGGWHAIDGGFTAFKTTVTDFESLE